MVGVRYMANIQISTAITRAISSGAYFTRIDQASSSSDDRELQKLNPELYNQRLEKFDSPNNIKGIIVQQSGIYVENYHGYGYLDKRDENKPKHIGQRIKTDQSNNEQFINDVKSVFNGEQRFNVNNNWLFQPVIQNLKYIYFDEALQAIIGRNFKSTNDVAQTLVQIVLNAPGQKGKPTRQRFPKLQSLAYVSGIGKTIKEQRELFNKIYSKVQSDELWLETYCNETRSQKVLVDLTKVNGWGPCGVTQTRGEIYLYDKLFIDEKASKEQEALDEQKRADSERNKQIETEGYGIPGVFEAKEQYKDIIEQYLVNPVISGYKYLLQIGYSGPRSNDGMLTDRAGQIYLGSKGQLVLPNRADQADKKFMIKDVDLYSKLNRAMKNQGVNVKQLTNTQVNQASLQLKDSIAYYNKLIETNENEVTEFNYVLGLKLIKGYLCNCKIHKDYSEGSTNQTQIVNWQGVKEYLKETLTDLCAILLVTNGIVKTSQSAAEMMESNEVQIVTDYCQNLKKAFCFGIYVQKQFQLSGNKELLQSELRICLPVSVNIDKFFNDLQSEMPVKIKKVNSAPVERNSIYNMFTIKVLYDEDPTKGMISATKALESLKEKNLKPQWSNALLGEKDDGTPFFWKDFMGSNNQPYKRAYQIYAGSRSGKGILTNTLIANAIANGYKVFFVDGKPDTGITIGNLAWKDGKEAFVFDGMRSGSSQFSPGQLEDYQYGVRSPRESLIDINKIPRGIRSIKIPTDIIKSVGQQDFGELLVATTVYYKCVELIFKMIEYRAAGNHGQPEDDWAVFIIDECAKMAEREQFIRKYFFNYVKSVNARHNNGIPYKPSNKDESKVVWNEELQFIANWLNWLDGIQSQVQTAQTMSLGNSQQNIFFIFQGSKWISQYSDTFMSKGLMRLSTTKILGHDAIEQGSPSVYGNTTTKNTYDWPKYLNDPMHWVITKDSDAGSCGDDKVSKFKPYSLWGSTKEQMIDGQSDDFRFMQYYMREISKAFGVDVAEVLNQAYRYASDFVTQVSNKQNLKQYIYGLDFLLTQYDDETRSTGQKDNKNDYYKVDAKERVEEQQESQIYENVEQFQHQWNSRKQAEEQLDSILNKPEKSSKGLAERQFKIYEAPSKQVETDTYEVKDDYGMTLEDSPQNNYEVKDDYGMRFEDEKDPYKFEIKLFNQPFKTKQNGEELELEENSNTDVIDNSSGQKISEKSGIVLQWVRNKVDRYSPLAIAGNVKYALKQQGYNLVAGGALLSTIADQVGGYRKVNEIQIVQNQVWVNGKYIVLPQYMQDEEGVMNIQSILSFRKLFKNFKNLKELNIDQNLWNELKEEFDKDGPQRIQNIFKNNKKLQGITIISQINGKAVHIDRQAGLRFNCQEQAEDKMRKAMEKNQKTYKSKSTLRDQKKLQIISRTKNAIKSAKDEAWGSPVNKALTITTTAATMGIVGLAFGPLMLLGAQLVQNIAVRQVIKSNKNKE